MGAASAPQDQSMKTVFSHIVQSRLSQENENVATEALAFIVESSDKARSGLMKLLRGIAPDLPPLRFRTQRTAGTARPDMWGYDGGTPRVFVENKFWAGLTENQPVEYLRQLAEYPNPSVLLIVVPEARLGTVWRELQRRLAVVDVVFSNRNPSANVPHVVAVDFGPSLAAPPGLAITSWAKVLTSIEAELADEPHHRNDLLQLRALCDAADNDAFAPFASTELTNQRMPSFVLHLSSVVQAAVDLGVTEGVLSTDGLRGPSSWERLGRFISFPKAMRIGGFFGTDFRLWRERGSTPLWLVFSQTQFGRALEVRDVLEPWAEREGLECSTERYEFAVGIDLLPGEEKEQVVRSIVHRLSGIAAELSKLTSKSKMTA
jgi:hypothetical protein